MAGTVDCAVQADGLAVLTLREPARMNAMSRAMWLALREAALALARDDTLRCIVVRGEGGHFCAGGDISEYPGFRFQPDTLRRFHEDEVWGGLQALLDCDVPLVAHIEGNCMGAGVEIASCCDLRIAAVDARFGAPIGKLGFPMAPRELQLVGSQVGLTLARRMLYEGALLGAEDLLRAGFLARVCPPSELANAVADTVRRVMAQAPAAARMNKRNLRALATSFAPPDTMQALVSSAYDYAADPEHREGITAFLEKRPPSF